MSQTDKTNMPLMDVVKHYGDVILNKKWIVTGLFVLMTPLAYFAIQKSGKLEPGERVSVQLGMHQPLQEENMREYRTVYLQKIELLKSRSFLTDVIQEMSLYLQLKDIPREKVFDTLKVDEFCIKGDYRFVVYREHNRYSILLSNENMGYSDRTVRSGKLSQLSQVSFPGFFVKFSPQFLENPFPFEFKLISSQKALYSLLKNFEVNSPTLGNPSFRISLQGKDSKLITSTINYIADHFIQQDILLRKQRTDRTVALLEKQLETANKRREQSLRELNAYLSRNPDVALDQRLEQTVSDLSSLESSQTLKSDAQIEANHLLKNYKQASRNDRVRVVGEILDFLRMHEVTTASFLYDEYTRVLEEKAELEVTYAPNHRLIRENSEKVGDIENKAVGMLSKYIDKLALEQSKDKKQITSLTQKVNSLPNKYTRLAELRGTHTTHSQTYSSILSRYNEAKLATSVEIADFFVIDYALEPLPTPEILYYLKLIAISLGIGLMFSVSPIIIRENLKGTASSSFDLLKFRKLSLLELLPNIRAFNKHGSKPDGYYPRIAALNRTMTSDAYVETMRSLSTKLLMKNPDDRGYVVVSLEPGVGKSTVAANLSATMALRNMKTLLIDADLRKGIQANLFSLGEKKGLSGILKSDLPVTEEMIREYAQPTKIKNLFVLPCGEYEYDSFELMSSEKMKQVKNMASSSFDVVVLDTPPLGVCADAVCVADYFSCYIPVALAGKTNIPRLIKKLEEFPLLGGKVAGLLLNRVSIIDSGGYYYHYGYQKKKNKGWDLKPLQALSRLVSWDSISKNIGRKADRLQIDFPKRGKEPLKISPDKETYLLLQKKRSSLEGLNSNEKKVKQEPDLPSIRESVGNSQKSDSQVSPPSRPQIKSQSIVQNKPQKPIQVVVNQVKKQSSKDEDLSYKFKSLLLK